MNKPRVSHESHRNVSGDSWGWGHGHDNDLRSCSLIISSTIKILQTFFIHRSENIWRYDMSCLILVMMKRQKLIDLLDEWTGMDALMEQFNQWCLSEVAIWFLSRFPRLVNCPCCHFWRSWPAVINQSWFHVACTPGYQQFNASFVINYINIKNINEYNGEPRYNMVILAGYLAELLTIWYFFHHTFWTNIEG